MSKSYCKNKGHHRKKGLSKAAMVRVVAGTSKLGNKYGANKKFYLLLSCCAVALCTTFLVLSGRNTASNRNHAIYNNGYVTYGQDVDEASNYDVGDDYIYHHDDGDDDVDKEVVQSPDDEHGTQSSLSLQEFIDINRGLTSYLTNLTSPIYNLNKKCECGCFRSPIKSCPRQYQIAEVIKSSNVLITKEIGNYMDFTLQKRKRLSQAACLVDEEDENDNNGETVDDNNPDHTDSGGYCLQKHTNENSDKHTLTYPYSKRRVPIPFGHINAPRFILDSLDKFIEKEQKENDMSSLSDFGAGIGQYGAHLESKFSDSLIYYGYDGAGDVEDYTHGYLSFFDLTIPLNLPKTDWILCLEVGEHVPYNYEGMMIRNLHAHNCKGIIISWGIEGQGGENHINLHNNEYIIEVFEELGYVYDADDTDAFRSAIPEGRPNGFWFRNSLMVLRRKNPVC